MAELKLIRPEDAAPVAEPGEFTETETAKEIMDCLYHVRANPGEDIGMIIGAPGTGKTTATHRFAMTVPGVVLHRAVKGEGGVWNTANAMSLRFLQHEANPSRLDEVRRLIGRGVGEGGVLIIDQAENLMKATSGHKDNWEAFDWLRTMSEDWGVGLVFCGGIGLGDLQAVLPQLWARACPRLVISRPTREDVRMIAAQWGVSEKRSVELLTSISQRAGGLISVTKVIRKAWVFAGDRAPSLEHLTAAAEFFYPLQGAK